MFCTVPGVTAASSICIVPERQPPGRGDGGSASLPAISSALLITVDRHSSLCAACRLQVMIDGMTPGTTYSYGRQGAPGPGA